MSSPHKLPHDNYRTPGPGFTAESATTVPGKVSVWSGNAKTASDSPLNSAGQSPIPTSTTTLSAYSGRRRPEYQRLLSDIGAGSGERVCHLAPRPTQSFAAGTRTPHRSTRTQLGRGRIGHRRILRPRDPVRAGDRPHSRRVGPVRVGTQIRTHKGPEISAGSHRSAIGRQPSARSATHAINSRSFPTEAKIIRELMRRLLAGESPRQLRLAMDARGMTTSEGNPWTTHGIRPDADRPPGSRAGAVYPFRKGTPSDHGAEFLVRAQWPAIVVPRRRRTGSAHP